MFCALDTRPQVQRTRSTILRAAERLASGGIGGMTMATVAAEAGVSLRTLYRYFPTRAELLDSVTGASRATYPELGSPRTPAELVYRLIRALPAMDHGGVPQPDPARARHQEAVAGAVAASLRRLPPREQQSMLAAIMALASGHAHRAFRESAGLDEQQATRAVTWTIERLLASMEGDLR
jgi:AcrR family transcriptional regulator